MARGARPWTRPRLKHPAGIARPPFPGDRDLACRWPAQSGQRSPGSREVSGILMGRAARGRGRGAQGSRCQMKSAIRCREIRRRFSPAALLCCLAAPFPSASSPLPKPIPGSPNRSTSPTTGSTGSRYLVDSPTSTTWLPNCPRVTTNRVSEAHKAMGPCSRLEGADHSLSGTAMDLSRTCRRHTV